VRHGCPEIDDNCNPAWTAPLPAGALLHIFVKESLKAMFFRFALLFAALLAASTAHASFLPPEMMDAAAMGIAWFVIVVVPIGAIVLFWMVHVLPEKIAHKRHHPQQDAIHTLCLLSLVFGGLLWPIAWLWAYTKPVGYRLAYGTDKHDSYFDEMAEKQSSGTLVREEAHRLREELEAMEARGVLPPKLKALKDELARLRLEEAMERAPAPASAPTPTATPTSTPTPGPSERQP
jgi:hypothetical protein